MSDMALTEKQEKFCRLVVELNNNSEAYRGAYNASNMKPESIHRKAKELVDNVNVAARIAILREEHRQRHRVTVDDILGELEEARQIALHAAETPQTSAAVAATMGKAKLLGLDKQLIELSGTVTTRTTLSDFYGSDA
jgi:phage terminase small subunit